ncbi:ATP-dependent helicase HrpB [Novipirellula herctigrandis]|uniref:ATP-dependent helicase HrpB n=1 Tax=Novipirellula herctigrandis TaxID=2527986 RepID=UPI003AF3A3AD
MNPIDTHDLPVADCLPAILEGVSASKPVVLKAPPGAGKTTLVPLALMQSGAAIEGQILLIQPRRLAARAAAIRLSEIVGSPLGQTVGYHVRFDRRACADTQILVLTTGMLLRRLTDDPLLESVGCVILDEFHERSLELDLSLGMIERVRTTLRPELKLVVMSATLDAEPLVKFFAQSDLAAVAVESQGREYPVDVQYAPSLAQQPIDERVIDVLPRILRQTRGHVLVFLPGVGEIRRVHRAIERHAFASECLVCELYGEMSSSDQDAVVRVSNKRKVILSTNVAETSVTIPGVTAVIDSGMARVMTFRPQVGMPRLTLQPISQASAEQRAGRAGRTEPGICVRLWPQAAHRSRRENDCPEIEQADFSSAALLLAAWGERDTFAFPWLTPPSRQSVEQAARLLLRMDAINEGVYLTSIGKRMSKLPLHPRIARFMIAAEDSNVPMQDAAIAAALLSERSPLANRSATRDLIDQIDAMKRFIDGDKRGDLLVSAAKQVSRVAKQLLRTMRKKDTGKATPTALSKAFLAAYPDRVTKRREASSGKGVMVGGRGVEFQGQNGVSDLCVCMDVDDKGTDAIARIALPIEPSWLCEHLMKRADQHVYDPSREAVIARRREYYDDLLLNESPIQCEPSEAVAALLYEAIYPKRMELIGAANREAFEFFVRSNLLARWMPDLDLPRLDDEAADQVLRDFCQTRTSINQLRSAPWLAIFKSKFDYGQLQQFERFAPQRLTVPSGNSIRIEYSDSSPPSIAVRIQELFGWTRTPTIAGGKVAIQLHLLGPNHRPQQITDDLESFWKNTYVSVRKDLRRRYPKHHWPEDPLSAKATHNGLKPKGP